MSISHITIKIIFICAFLLKCSKSLNLKTPPYLKSQLKNSLASHFKMPGLIDNKSCVIQGTIGIIKTKYWLLK